MLENYFKQSLKEYDQTLINLFFKEIKEAYLSRKYHNLSHIKMVLNELKPFNIDKSLLFAIYYHDFIYDIKKNNNELESAIIAKKRANSLGFLKSEIDVIHNYIIATKEHKKSTNFKINLFCDADKSILGKDEYSKYKKAIRKEYSIYNKSQYKKGRLLFLEKTLNSNIYNTNHF